jgi:hypothetical protein
MSNEISYNTRFVVANGSMSRTVDYGTLRDDQAAIGCHSSVVSVGSGAEEDMPTGDLATPGWVVLRNLDSTNYVTYGPKSGGVMVPFGKIAAGDCHRFYLAGSVTMRWQANTAACKVDISIFEA